MSVPEHLLAAPCEHGVELDMCDTYACAQELNRLEEAYRAGWNRAIAANPVPPVSTEQAETLRWAAKTLRGVPIDCTALTGPVWYGTGWKDATDHLEDLADNTKEN